MPDLTITGLAFKTKPSVQAILLGVDVAAFDVVYKPATGYAPANATTQETAQAIYIALHAGLAGEYVGAVAIKGTAVITGDTLVQGGEYVVSVNDGKIAPRADLVSTNVITSLFTAASATEAQMLVDATGVVVP